MKASSRTLALLIGLAVTFYPFIGGADDTGNAENEAYCRMEIRYYSSFDSCDHPNTIATAFVYADGKCHSVETDLDPSDENYSLLPGIYRLECNSDNTLTFRDSACVSGTCSQDATCQRDDSSPGILYSLEVGQVVQDPSDTESYYCETLFDENTSMIFAVFGDCSQPGCSINGSINPVSPSPPNTSPTATQSEEPTRTPITSTNSPERTPVLSETPTSIPVATSDSPTRKPSPVATSSPATRAPIITTLAPVTSNPITVAPITISPSARTVSPASAPTTASPTFVPSTVPTGTPFVTNPTRSPIGSPTQSPIRSPVKPPITATQPPSDTVTQESSGNNNLVLFSAIGGSVSVIALLVLFVMWKPCRRRSSVDSKNGALATTSTSSDKTKDLQLKIGESNNNDQLGATTTNEIWFDPNRDDVSTLDGGTLPDMVLGNGGDEPTASVNNDFDYNKNRYRSSASGADEQSRFTSSTNPTAFTSFSKLGIRNMPSSVDDDQTFEQQFADMDEEEIMTAVGSMNWTARSRINNNNSSSDLMNDIANRVRPFEVMVPPGMLGLVIDTPNGSVPVIKAIKPTSVLYPQVQVGDRLISVDQQNVTNMSSLEVSRLITQKQHQKRVFVFCRLNLQPEQLPSKP